MATRLSPTVKCEICFTRFKSLAGHLRTHGKTAKVYRQEFPDAQVVSPLTRRRLQVAPRLKLSQVEFTDERRRHISESQSDDKGNAWKGGISRHLYFGKGKHRLKKIFGDPLKCFYPNCDKVEGINIKAVDCHHLDGDHENNPLDGANWLPLCRRHHMLSDGRLRSATVEEVRVARKLSFKVHAEHMKNHYVGEVKTYHE